MTIQQNKEGQTLTVGIEGRIDTQTAPELKAEMEKAVVDITELILDFSQVNYISSAGLRAIMTAQNLMDAKGGTMVIRNVNKNVKNIFKVTGLDSFVTLE